MSRQMKADRRGFLQYSLAAAALGVPLLRNQVWAQSALKVTQVRAGVSVIDAGGSNVIVRETADGLVLVDSGHPQFADSLMQQLRGIGSGRIHTLFNTHWHL